MKRKIVLSYGTFLLLPLLLFGILTHAFCGRYIIGYSLKEQQMAAERCVQQLNSLHTRITRFIDEIKLNRLFYLEDSKDIPVAFIDIRTCLQNIELGLDYAVDVYYYDLHNNGVHTSSGVFTQLEFLETLIKENSSIKKNTWLSYDSKMNYIVPLEYGENSILRSVMIYSIPQSDLDALLRSASGYARSVGRISYNGTFFYAMENTPLDRLNGSGYYAATSGDVPGGFSVEYYIPKAELQKDLWPVIGTYVSVSALLLLIGAVIFGRMLRKNYQPIGQIFLRISRAAGVPERHHTVRDLEFSAAEVLRTREAYQLDSRKAMRECFLLRLIFSQGKPQKAFETAKRLGVSLSGSCYVCVAVRFHREKCQIAIPDTVNCEHIWLDEQNCCMILSGGRHILDDTLIAVAKKYGQGSPEELQIGIGSIVSEMAALSESFRYAQIARHDAARGQLVVVRYHDGVNNVGASGYPEDLFEALENACQSADADDLRHCTRRIRDAVLKTPNRFWATCIYRDYFQSVSRRIAPLCIESFSAELLSDNFYARAPASREEILDMISGIEAYVLSCLDSSQRERRSLSIDAVQRYIAANYLEPEFSMRSLAEHMNTSQSNLSHFFRKETGSTLSEYVDLMKIERVKELLLLSGSSVNSVSQALGFANPSTFIRKFKKLVGMPPGEFRLGRAAQAAVPKEPQPGESPSEEADKLSQPVQGNHP